MNSSGFIELFLLLYAAFYISFTCITLQLVEVSAWLGTLGTKESLCDGLCVHLRSIC